MNEYEVRLRLHQHIHSILLDLAMDDEEEFSPEEEAEIKDAMNEVTEMILDSLDINVQDVEDGRATATLRIP